MAAALCNEGFDAKLGKLMGHDDRTARYFARVLDPGHAVSALSPSGKLLGFAGFKTEAGAFAGGKLRDFAAIYGCIGTRPLSAIMDEARTHGLRQVRLDMIDTNPHGHTNGFRSLIGAE